MSREFDLISHRGVAEGVGFEPTEAQKTSTVFETVPFVHSGTLPGRQVSGAMRPSPPPNGGGPEIPVKAPCRMVDD